MPQYLFKTRKTGALVELYLSVDEMMKLKRADGSWRLPDGRIADRDFTSEHSGVPCGENPGWPMICEAGGVMPKQREAAEAKCRAAGVPTSFTKGGDAVITGPGHYRKYLKAMGLHNKSSYD